MPQPIGDFMANIRGVNFPMEVDKWGPIVPVNRQDGPLPSLLLFPTQLGQTGPIPMYG